MTDGPGPERRREQGLAAFAKILDVAVGEVAADMTARVGTVFTEEALSSAGGAAWSPSTLTDRERDVAIITALVCQGVTGERLTNHLLLAHRHGLDEQGLTALMVLLANYAGYPRASTAMETTHAMLTANQDDSPDAPG